MSQLEQLKAHTTVVADTGEIDEIAKYAPIDATTNPSLILKAAQKPQYKHLIEDALAFDPSSKERCMDKLFVNFGIEILKLIPGRVSTEVNATLSFDVKKSVEKARHLITLYEEENIPRERILIKLASTWEGCEAARILEKEGIHTNMTLLFCLPQAIIADQAHATLISPFVGRISEWYKKHNNVQEYAPEEDPGVQNLREIYSYLKTVGSSIQIMGASFRSKEQVLALAGCDLLTLAPIRLQELKSNNDPITCHLFPETASHPGEKRTLTEPQFRFLLAQDPMTTELLASGIRNFAKDYQNLQQLVGRP